MSFNRNSDLKAGHFNAMFLLNVSAADMA